MGRIKAGIKGAWYYCWGHILGLFVYDKKYLQGKWFEGKLKGMCSQGWRWVVHDAIGRMIIRNNRHARFPISQFCTAINPENIEFHPDDLNNFQGNGQYYQAIGRIIIGKGTYIAPNVGLITSNHDPNNLDNHLPSKPITLGERCWIGMNSVILPGVTLGDGTIVGAGSIVTKSFPEGHCVIAGNPAKLIKLVETDKGEAK